MLMTTLLMYQSDMNLYVRNSMSLEKAAEEAALAAGNYFDKEDYSNGQIKINPNYNTIFSLIDNNINKNYWKGGIQTKILIVSEGSYSQVTETTRDISGKNRTNLFSNDIFPSSDGEEKPRIMVVITGYNPDFRFGLLKVLKINVEKKGLCEIEGH